MINYCIKKNDFIQRLPGGSATISEDSYVYCLPYTYTCYSSLLLDVDDESRPGSI